MSVRIAFLISAALLLAACDSGAVPSPAERQMQQSVAPSPAKNIVLLDGRGFALGSKTHYFSAERSLVERELTQTLGAAEASGTNNECGAGPIAYANYTGGLTVNFQNDRLAGWNLTEGAEQVMVAGDVQVGTPRAEAEAASGYAVFEDSTLGEEFTLGSQMGGFIEDDTVSMLYAGTQCFFR